jgi:hypothetical protein
MTPTEKSEELINNLYEINCKFFKVSTSEERFERYNILMPLCIESAIFTVDNILIAIQFNMYDEDAYDKELKFWQKVKTEIEKNKH